MTAEPKRDELVILPPLKAQKGPGGGFILTQKYIDGVAEFARNWNGPVTSLVNLSTIPTTDMDHVEFAADDPVTPIELRPQDMQALAARLRNAAVVLGFLSSEEEPLLKLCQDLGVPLVLFSEYSPVTERQIIDTDTPNLLRRWRRRLWLRGATKTRRDMAAQCAGLQCSGHPVHDAYGALNPHTLLFFDNRVRDADILSEAQMAAKAVEISAGRPLRLVFGGRLIEMKGVRYLPKFASELRAQGTPFSFDIYGSGPLEAQLRQDIAAAGLDNIVTLKGAVDFQSGWIPMLKAECDLFICPHPQGDPSSTYPEVMSCGVAIAGFDNEAFRSIAADAQSGWSVPIGDTQALATEVARLHEDRASLIHAAQNARRFAHAHCFEKTMQRRVAHFRKARRIVR